MLRNRPHWADKAFWWVAPIVILAAAGGGAYYYFQSRKDSAETKTKVAPAAPVAAENEAAIRHLVPDVQESQGEEPLPALNESDPAVRAALERMFGDLSVKKMLIPESIVRRIVVTIDNLPRDKVAVEKRPLKAVAGQTVTATAGDVVTLSAENFARYAPFVRLVSATDTRALVDLYFHFYPLFQRAYEDLGYPGRYFNDRLVDVIDNLLATPDVAGPITLLQPRVFYEFADPKLEARPAGQKVLIRMGPENAAVVKAKLRELRKAVTSGRQLPPASPQASAAQPGIVSPAHGGLRHWL